MLSEYQIRRIDCSTANEVVVREHYLHRAAPCVRAFGLYNQLETLVGVITYGVPASVPLVKGVLGNEHRHLVGELTRLWVSDSVPKNGESFLIGRTIKLSGFPVLVSYADTSAGHIGTVYQASNWLYTGLSSKHRDWVLRGKESNHSRHMWDEYGGIEKAKKLIPELMVQVDRPRKHRYVYINAKGAKRRKLYQLLKYPVLPYPKQINLVNN